MTQPFLPLLVEPAELEKSLGAGDLLIVDLCRAEMYAQMHLPGAVHLNYAQIINPRPPAMGDLPDANKLSEVFSSIGMTPESHVVAYDDEGGGRAARLLWTLDVIGHQRFSLLNGGLHVWATERRPTINEPVKRPDTDYRAHIGDRGIADKNYIVSHLRDPAVGILDARSPDEYKGRTKRAERAGHIPGAVNFEWVNALDKQNSLRIKPDNELRRALTGLGITPDKEIIVYCQTHHRSAHTYMVLKILGYEKVRGYPGSWSEWGNSPEVPIE